MLDGLASRFLRRRPTAEPRGIQRVERRRDEPYGLDPYRAVIVGGGVAALEAGLAFRALAGQLATIQMLAPDADFTFRPFEVREPFAGQQTPRFALAEFAASIDAELIADRLTGVDAVAREITTERGTVLPYDVLLLCLGATPLRRYEHARMIEPAKLDELLHGFVQDVEGGYVKSAAFIVPERVGWPLPIYELLLMTAERAYDSMADVALTLVTSEAEPLAAFGPQASAALIKRLRAAHVTVMAGATAEVPGNKRVEVTTAGDLVRLQADAIIALPELVGPAVPGLPHDEHGFLEIDAFGHVDGEPLIFAAGDGTAGAVKFGGLAAQQAEVAARGAAHAAGVDLEPHPLVPVLSGVLLTGSEPIVIGEQVGTQTDEDPGWAGARKVAAPRLSQYLATHAPLPRTGRR